MLPNIGYKIYPKKRRSTLKPGGLIILVVYYGHEEGKDEKEALENYVQNSPFILAIKRRKGRRPNSLLPCYLIILELIRSLV
ncbi:MAG TPA: class I SAM-dependent methyltransferase [Bacillota bacterium]|nr:class I SAM-dependent methyltransferase [Bacillota bacterium]